jgi:hypothetical protein
MNLSIQIQRIGSPVSLGSEEESSAARPQAGRSARLPVSAAGG